MALAPLVLLALLSYHWDGCLAASIPSLLIRGSTTVRKNFILFPTYSLFQYEFMVYSMVVV